MLTLILPPETVTLLENTLKEAGQNEVGGVLMAEHVEVNEFIVRDISIHRHGTLASFLRCIEEAWTTISNFFRTTKHDYVRFNYIGEWHSHPSFEPLPSAKDHCTMSEIVSDISVGANFVVLLIVKLSISGKLIGTIHTYLPNDLVKQSNLVIQR